MPWEDFRLRFYFFERFALRYLISGLMRIFYYKGFHLNCPGYFALRDFILGFTVEILTLENLLWIIIIIIIIIIFFIPLGH